MPLPTPSPAGQLALRATMARGQSEALRTTVLERLSLSRVQLRLTSSIVL